MCDKRQEEMKEKWMKHFVRREDDEEEDRMRRIRCSVSNDIWTIVKLQANLISRQTMNRLLSSLPILCMRSSGCTDLVRNKRAKGRAE